MEIADWGSDCGLGIVDCGLRIVDCGLWIADWGLRIEDCGKVQYTSLQLEACGLRLLLKSLRYRLSQNPQIQPQACIPHIKRVPLEPTEDAFICDGRTMITFHLGKTSNSGLDHVPEFITIHHLRKSTTIRIHVWPWSNEAHFSQEYINELGKFIDVCFAQHLSNPRDATIIFFGLPCMTFLIDIHGPKFQAVKTLSTSANSFLPEEYRTFRIHGYQDSQ